MALVAALVLVAFAVCFGLLRYAVPSHYTYLSKSSQIWPCFVWMCVLSPFHEEFIYRLALCVPIAAWVGPKPAIAISGALFAAAHILGGNPSPENQVGGFLLAWAFLDSQTILAPLAFHSLGNFAAFLCRVAMFLFLS